MTIKENKRKHQIKQKLLDIITTPPKTKTNKKTQLSNFQIFPFVIILYISYLASAKSNTSSISSSRGGLPTKQLSKNWTQILLLGHDLGVPRNNVRPSSAAILKATEGSFSTSLARTL